MHVGDVQQAEAGQVDATDGDVARHVVVFTAIVRDVSGVIVPQRMPAQNRRAFPPPLKADVAPVLVDVEPMPPFPQAPANPKRHVRRRLAVRLGDGVVPVFADLLKTNRVYALLSHRLGDDVHLAFVQVHGFETVVARVLLVSMQIQRQQRKHRRSDSRAA